MAKRQNFVIGSTSVNIEAQTPTQLNHAWDPTVVLRSNKLNGVFNAVSDYSNDSSNEIANAIQSITGAEPTGVNQSELASALQLMRQEIETKSLTFKGYVATSAPSSSTYALEIGNIWINSATLPTSFPVAIAGVWNGTQWTSTTDTYSPSDFDFFRNINDNEGYYWFGGQWTVMSTDLSTTYFTLNQGTGKWEIKSSVELPGTPTVETEPATSDSSKKIPSTGWVNAAIAVAMPTGAIIPYGGSSAPAGWLLCNGQAVSRTTYAELFAIIGTAYGVGDGSTTFNLPDYSDRVPQGNGRGYVSAGLPNITGAVGSTPSGFGPDPNGAFYQNGSTYLGYANTPVTMKYVYMDASRSNSIYSNSATVQPPAVKTYFIIKY